MSDLCNVIWVTDCVDSRCPETADCLEDIDCAPSVKPPTVGLISAGCGCIPLGATKVCVSAAPEREWLDSTLNIEVFSGSAPLRNVLFHVFQNPLGLDCGDEAAFPECAACTTLLVNYIPAGSTFILSGEERKVTMTCGSVTKNASSNVSDVTGQPFDWPDIACSGVCICITVDDSNTSADAAISITRIDREL